MRRSISLIVADLGPGEPVHHVGLGWQGVLEKLEDGRAQVLVRGKRVRCRPEELVSAALGETIFFAEDADTKAALVEAGAEPASVNTVRRTACSR